MKRVICQASLERHTFCFLSAAAAEVTAAVRLCLNCGIQAPSARTPINATARNVPRQPRLVPFAIGALTADAAAAKTFIEME